MGTQVRPVDGEGVGEHADGIRRVYADVFSAPPWNEDRSMAALYTERLARDALRPGFTAALALDGDTVTGFATAWTTPASFPDDRSYGDVATALGPRRVAAWLCGGLEVNELAVSTRARRTGLGAALLAAVTAPDQDSRCRLLTSVRAQETLRFYAAAGWRQVPVPVPGKAGLVVLLGPRPPAPGPHRGDGHGGRLTRTCPHRDRAAVRPHHRRGRARGHPPVPCRGGAVSRARPRPSPHRPVRPRRP